MVTIVTRAAKGSALTHAELDANQTNLNAGKAEILAFATLNAAAAITGAAHANRDVDVTSAVNISCTFAASTANFANKDYVIFHQEGSGVLTITGDVELAPGIESMTTNGLGSQLVCVYSSTSQKLRAVLRTAAAVGGGVNNVSLYTFASTDAPTNSSENNVINAQSIGGAIAAGSEIRFLVLGKFQSSGLGQGVWLAKLNGTTIQQYVWASEGVPSKTDEFVTICHGSSAQSTGMVTGQGSLFETTINTTGANTFTLAAQRIGANLTRTASARVLVTVTRA